MAKNWTNMTRILQNSKTLVNFSQKIQIIDPVHSVIMYRHGVWPKNWQVAAIGGVQGPQNGSSKSSKDRTWSAVPDALLGVIS